MKVTYSGTNIGRINLNDIGSRNKFGSDGQGIGINHGDSLELRDTDTVIKSYLKGTIKKFIDDGNFVVDAAPVDAVQTTQEAIAGIASGVLATVNYVNAVTSILAYVTATGAPAAKTLLEETVDYTLLDGEITIVTDQSANTLIVSYQTPISVGV